MMLYLKSFVEQYSCYCPSIRLKTKWINGAMERDDSSVVVDVRAMRMMGFKHLKGIDSSDYKSEVDKYLAKSCEDVLDEKFDILAW